MEDKILKELERAYLNKNFEKWFSIIAKDPKDEYLEFLCKLCCEKRRKWVRENKEKIRITGDLKEDILNIYKEYFGLEIPKDGIISYYDGKKLVIDWFCSCPVLGWRIIFNLDERICRKIYHKPVQVLLDEILPYKVIFDRDYEKIRPKWWTCREIFRKV